MGGKIKKPKSSRRNSGSICRPAAFGWQKWQQDDSGTWSLEAEAENLAGLRPDEDDLIATPVRRMFSLAVWVPSADPSLFSDLVFTQLDLHGLAGPSKEATSFVWNRLADEGGETLLHAAVLPAHLAPQYRDDRVTAYAPSPSCMPLPEDAVSIWKEEGAWVVAVTKGKAPVHFQPLSEPHPTMAMAREVWLMLASLEAGGMLSGITGVKIFQKDSEEPFGLDEWRASGLLPVELMPLPPPQRPPDTLLYMPQAVQEAQRLRQTSARRQKIALAAAAIYFTLALILVGATVRLHWEAQSLRETLAREADTVQSVKQAKSRWEALYAAIDTSGYPLETLYQISRLLPKEGVRLTLFSANLNHLVVSGEASTLQAAQKFQEDVRDSPQLAAYDWNMENPRPLPTGNARFQINGIRRNTIPHTENSDNESPDI